MLLLVFVLSVITEDNSRRSQIISDFSQTKGLFASQIQAV